MPEITRTQSEFKAEYETLPEFWRVYIMGLERVVNTAKECEQRFMAILGPELLKRREEQDASHGGPEHDDTHTPEDWCRFIHDYAYRARLAALQGSEVSDSLVPVVLEPDHAEYENRMLDVAALAISAIQSSRRRNHPMRWTPQEGS